MVEKRLGLEEEVQEAFQYIDAGNNFLLSGGAGSGKTYSLVKIIDQILLENINVGISCITYTNAAVNEINSRVQHENLYISTIHEFLWNCIKPFQVELKKVIIDLINDEDNSDFIIDSELVKDNLFQDKTIQYLESRMLKEGIISHDDLLTVANKMFQLYPKLSTIVKSKYGYIFIDEYQDTERQVIEIFLEHINQGKNSCVIGLFGDSMQSIYDSGIGDVNQYIAENKIIEIQKHQNRRNPQLVMDLANKLRTDGIIQIPSQDTEAPNMVGSEVKQGKINFYYSKDEDGVCQHSCRIQLIKFKVLYA